MKWLARTRLAKMLVKYLVGELQCNCPGTLTAHANQRRAAVENQSLSERRSLKVFPSDEIGTVQIPASN